MLKRGDSRETLVSPLLQWLSLGIAGFVGGGSRFETRWGKCTRRHLGVFGIWVRGLVIIVALQWAVSGGWSGTTDAAPKPFSACSLVSLEDEKGLWDAGAKLDVSHDNPYPNGQNIAVCRYVVLAGQYVEKYMNVEVTRPVTRAQFETKRQQDEMAFNKVQKVAGLGDEAYSFGFYSFGTVTFLKGQCAVKVTVEYKRDNTIIDPARIVAGIIPIARRAASRPV